MSMYRLLPDDILIAFFHEIKHNIENGLLSDLMNNELDLIYDVILERNLEVLLFHKRGADD